MEAMTLGLFAVGGLIALGVLILLPAVYIHTAARLSKVRKPFRLAILATIFQIIVQGVLTAIVGGVSAALTPMTGLLVGIPLLVLSVLVDLWIIQVVYSVDYGKSCSIWLTAILEAALTAVVIFAVAVFSSEAAQGNLPQPQFPSYNFDIPWEVQLQMLLWRWPALVNGAAVILAGGLWYKTAKAGKDQNFWIWFSLGWTMICISYIQTGAVGIQLVERPLPTHLLYIAGYILIGISFWIAPQPGDARQAQILAGIFILTLLIVWFIVTPMLSTTVYGGGRSGPWEETEPLRHREWAAVSLAALTTLAAEAWMRLRQYASSWRPILIWPTIGVTLAGAMAWLTVAVWKMESYPWLPAWIRILFFAQAALLGMGLYRALQAEKEKPALQAVPNP